MAKAEGFSSLVTPSIAPYGIFPINYAGEQFYAFTGLAKVYGYMGGSQADITRVSGGDYAASIFTPWNGGVFNGLLYLNVSTNTPQVWDVPDLGTPLVPIPNWPGGGTIFTAVLRNFLQFLIALDVTESGTRFRRRIRWSHSATTGWPSSWDETDPTNDAGVYDLPDGEGAIIYGEPLGDVFVVYAEGETWFLRASGSSNIFNFYRPFDTAGIMAQRCCTAFRKGSGPNMHFVVTQDDFIIHDTTRLQSVAEKSLRRWFLNNLDTSAYTIVHAVTSKRNKEIRVYFPMQGAGLVCNAALIWNYETGVWSFFDGELVPNVRFVARSDYGVSFVPEDTWDSGVDEQWETGEDVGWSTLSQEIFSETILMAVPATPAVLVVEPDNYTAGGTEFSCVAEHDSLSLIGMSERGEPASDGSVQKMLIEVWPVLEGPAGLVVTIEAGAREFAHETAVYTVSTTFTLGTDKVKPLTVTGRFLSLRYTWAGTSASALIAHAPDIVPLGVF